MERAGLPSLNLLIFKHLDKYDFSIRFCRIKENHYLCKGERKEEKKKNKRKYNFRHDTCNIIDITNKEQRYGKYNNAKRRDASQNI